MQFLIVEDSPAMRRVIINAISKLGFHQYYEAEDGKVALEILKDHKIDFLIVDWLIPMLDGVSIVKVVRKSDAHSHIPILMVTSRDSKNDVLEALKAGVDDYCTKPFTLETFHSKVNKVLEKYKKTENEEEAEENNAMGLE